MRREILCREILLTATTGLQKEGSLFLNSSDHSEGIFTTKRTLPSELRRERERIAEIVDFSTRFRNGETFLSAAITERGAFPERFRSATVSVVREGPDGRHSIHLLS